MDIKLARKRYRQQQKGAADRGIGWEITFPEWLAWWGDDLDSRGRGREELGMCRYADKGPYKLGNIYKGTPAMNTRTKVNVYRNTEADKAKAAWQKALDDAPIDWEERDELTEDEKELRNMFKPFSASRFSMAS